MSFLIDENLSWRLERLLIDAFPGCRHVTACGLQRASDEAIWAYARTQGLHLLSKDDDMRALVEARGGPPKLVWLRLGNVSTNEIAAALRQHAQMIRAFLSGNESILEIVPSADSPP